MEAKAVQGRREGALVSVFLDWCYGHKGLCTPFLFPGGKYGLSIPSSPTFAWSLAPDGNVEGERESALGKRVSFREERTAGWEKVGCPGALSGSQYPQKPRHPPGAPHQVLPPHSQFSVTLGPNDGFHLSPEIWSASSCLTKVLAQPCHVPGLRNLQASLPSAENCVQVNI